MRDREIMINELNECMEDGVNRGVFPGANYCLIIDEQKYYGCFGNKSLKPIITSNHIDTIYDIASLSKVVSTTTAVLKLIESGQLNIDDTLCKYLPYLKDKNVTIKDVLTHSSGYPALTPNTEDMKSVKPLLKDLLNCRLTYETGSKVMYSDVGFMYLGFVIDEITGSFSRYVKKNVFDPLNMLDTCYNNKNLDRIAPTEIFGFRGLIHGEVHDEKGYLLGGVAGHAGIYSTVKDLSNFAEMLMNKGIYNKTEILCEKSLKYIQEKIMLCEDESYRSIGWIVKKVCGQEVIYHTGYTGTNFMVDFKNRISFILLSNRVHPTRKNTKIISFRKELENIIYKNVLGDKND